MGRLKRPRRRHAAPTAPFFSRFRGQVRLRLRRLASAHASHWRRNYIIAGPFLVLLALCTFLLANTLNYRDRPSLIPPYISTELGTSPSCQPNWLFYPEYAAVLGLPPPLVPSLFPSKKAVRSAYRKTRVCWHPDKQRLHPGLTDADLVRINRLIEDARDKLLAGEGWPRQVRHTLLTEQEEQRFDADEDSWSQHKTGPMPCLNCLADTQWWKTPIVDVAVPSFRSGCTPQCAFGDALERFWHDVWTPYWKHEWGIRHASELNTYCPPCNFDRATAVWRQTLSHPWNILRGRKALFDQDTVPPRAVHYFWFTHELADLATHSHFWAVLRAWGQDGSPVPRDVCRLNTAERIEGVRNGWFAIKKFR